MKKQILLIGCFFLAAQISFAQKTMVLKKPLSLQDYTKLQELAKKSPNLFSGTVQVNENGAIRTMNIGGNLAGKSEDKPDKPDPKPDPKGKTMGNGNLAGKSEEKPEKPDPKPDPKGKANLDLAGKFEGQASGRGFQSSPNTLFISQNPDALLKSQLNRILAPYQ